MARYFLPKTVLAAKQSEVAGPLTSKLSDTTGDASKNTFLAKTSVNLDGGGSFVPLTNC